MLAKLVGKCLYFPPEWVDEVSLTSDEWKEFEQHDPPENLAKTQQAVCKVEDTGDKIVMSWEVVPAQPDPAEAMMEIQTRDVFSQIEQSEDKTLGIKCMALFPVYEQNTQHTAGKAETHPETGYPWECMTSYNGSVQQDWTIDNRTLWKPWHSRDPEYALPWVAPTGAHDMYKEGEYMIWTDGTIKKCVQDTNFSPEEYAQAWADV